MNLQEGESLVAIVVGAVSLCSAIWLAAVKVGRLEVKVNTLWDFLLRWATGEAIRKGIATMSSPVAISEETRAWLEHLRPELQKIYAGAGPLISDADLATEIERQCGQRLVETVCIPRGLYHGEAMVVAIAVARETVKEK